jgi:peptide/nickel transport system ATP-binding protein
VPSLIGELRGCGFRNRCPVARDACATGEIELRNLPGGGGYRCILTREEVEAMAEATP